MISAQVKRKQLIRKWPEKLKEVNKGFLPEATTLVEGDAKLRAPRDKGFLIASIKKRIRADVGMVYSALDYAPHVEYGANHPGGTPYIMIFGMPRFISFSGAFKYGGAVKYTKPHKIPAQPYMRPALLENKTKIMRMWRRWFRSVYGR